MRQNAFVSFKHLDIYVTNLCVMNGISHAPIIYIIA